MAQTAQWVFIGFDRVDGEMKWKIGHTFYSHQGGYKNGPTSNMEYEHMDEWIKYFDRI